MSARFSDHVESAAAQRLLSLGNGGDNANDCLTRSVVATARVTAAGARRIAQDLGPLDLAVLESLSIIQIATGHQLRRLHWPDTDTGKRLARHHLAKLTKLRILARLERRVGGVRAGSEGYVYALDVVGQRVVAIQQQRRVRRPWTPGASHLAHALAVTDCYVTLKEAEAKQQLELVTFDGEPQCWRRYPGPGGRPADLKPDAFVITTAHGWELRHFIEVDRATEHPARITAKAQRYINYFRSGYEQHTSEVFPKVLWVAPDERRTTGLVDALARIDAESWALFQVTDVGHFVTAVLALSDGESA
ncbi:MAG: hypothetical protein QOK43_1970 [Acidimicrobiaceae bacterium]|nr:hypothetical protein [Acidimicrobiaceae bacterium]